LSLIYHRIIFLYVIYLELIKFIVNDYLTRQLKYDARQNVDQSFQIDHSLCSRLTSERSEQIRLRRRIRRIL